MITGKTFRASIFILGLLTSACISGCSGSGAGVPIEGTVTVDGEPIDVGSITFIPEEKGQKGGGLIQDGKYTVTPKTGLTPGKYRVEIRWQKKTGKMFNDPDTGEKQPVRKQALPAKFNSKSELTAELQYGSNTKDFPLSTGA